MDLEQHITISPTGPLQVHPWAFFTTTGEEKLLSITCAGKSVNTGKICSHTTLKSASMPAHASPSSRSSGRNLSHQKISDRGLINHVKRYDSSCALSQALQARCKDRGARLLQDRSEKGQPLTRILRDQTAGEATTYCWFMYCMGYIRFKG